MNSNHWCILLLMLCLRPSSLYAQSTGSRSGCQSVNITATAYYSPLEKQAFFAQGSRESEKTLNGRGVYSASGKPVFDGLAAGPSSLAFGTIVKIDGRGSVQIEDRGGNISESLGNQDLKIDIRAGKGELGLARALGFGRRTFSGCILDLTGSTAIQTQTNNKIGIDRSKVPIFKYFFDVTIGQVKIDLGRNDPRSGIIKMYLRKLGYTVSDGRIIDAQTTQSICEFQLQQNILTDKSDPLCGIVGSKTAGVMRSLVQQQGLGRKNLFEQL